MTKLPIQQHKDSIELKMSEQPIGIFDSGVGGLSITKYIHQCLPNEKLIYIADTQYAPYGNQSADVIAARVNFIAQTLMNKKIKALVIACNTATVNAIEQLRKTTNMPIIGVEPAIKPAALFSKTKKVALLVTQPTAINERFLALVEQYKNGSEVIIQPCPGLVEFIEQGQHNSQQCFALLESWLLPLINKGVDTLVLGCTHYPFVSAMITAIVGDKIKIMETAKPVTEQLSRQLALYNIKNNQEKSPQPTFLTTKHSSQLESLMSSLFKRKIKLEEM
jgi:glutamate racemase